MLRTNACRWALLGLGTALTLAACSSDSDDPNLPGGPNGGNPAARLEQDTQVKWVVETDPATKTASLAFPVTPIAPVLGAGADAFRVAAEFLARYPEVFGVAGAADLENVEAERDELGLMHVHFQQRALGKPVSFARIMVHFDPQGGVDHVSGPFYPTLAEIAAQTPAIDAAGASQRAVAAVLGLGAWEVKPTASATLLVSLDRKSGLPRLEYRVPLVDDLGQRVVAIVDAMTGAYVDMFSLHQSVAGSGTNPNGETVSFQVDAPQNGVYTMTYTGSGNRPTVSILAVTNQDADGNVTTEPVTSSSATAWEQSAPASGKGSAVDTMAKFQRVESWFRSRLGRPSFDNKGIPVRVQVYLSDANGPNAYYSGGGKAADDDSKLFGFTINTATGKPYTQTDVVAHEFMHAVTAHTANLYYGGESGALNEGLSDIFGQLIEHDITGGGGDPALVAEEFGTAMRNMRNPGEFGDATHTNDMDTIIAGLSRYQGYDSGGVHILSGIPNLAWYLMAFGGAHPNGSEVAGTPLGMEASRRLWWDLVRWELKEFSSFRDAAQKSMLIARYQGVSKQIVGCAWQAVGVLTNEELKSNYGVECTGVDPINDALCEGKGTQVLCHPTVQNAAIYCVDDAYIGIDFCVDDQGQVSNDRCVSAEQVSDENSNWFRAVCEPNRSQDSCAGREDGNYCSEIESTPYAGFECQGEAIINGKFCAESQRCTGFDAQTGEIRCE